MEDSPGVAVARAQLVMLDAERARRRMRFRGWGMDVSQETIQRAEAEADEAVEAGIQEYGAALERLAAHEIRNWLDTPINVPVTAAPTDAVVWPSGQGVCESASSIAGLTLHRYQSVSSGAGCFCGKTTLP